MASTQARAQSGLRPPSRLLMLAETRAIFEFGLTIAAMPLLATAPRGDGHPVLVLPGFLASDQSTELMRGYLRALGYDAVGWDLGRNLGGLRRLRSVLRAQVGALSARHGGAKVSIVGWSLGGVFARILAITEPDIVRGIIMLGTPFAHDLSASNASALYDRVSGEPSDRAEPADIAAVMGDMPVPTTSIFSRTDGIVNWRTSQVRPRAEAENIEIHGASHVGLGLNPAALWAIADRLAQPDGAFARFRGGGPFRAAYGLERLAA